MLKFLTEDTKITVVKTAQAAGTSTITSDSVDMQGYDGVCFLCYYGTAAANNLITAEQSADDSSYADLEGSQPNSAGASTELQYVDIVRPTDRYVRIDAVRGTSSTIDLILAIRYRARSRAIDNNTAGTIEGERLLSPAEGTA